VIHQVDRAAAIVKHLRTFGRTAPGILEPLAIHDAIHAALSLMAEPLRLADIELTQDLCEPAPVVFGDRIQLEQVFINLLANGRDACRDRHEKRMTVTTLCRECTVEVSVNDTGTGIPEDLLPRIFDPFFTTKPVGEGTGLGLSITYGIIKAHGGTISVTSALGEGSSFTLRLPLAR
jgi:C4-dicarboxylate-specific signal transduction histidine kinase